jgi:hypothetical protein
MKRIDELASLVATALEGSAQVGLGDEIVVHRAQDGRRRRRDSSRCSGGLRLG